MPTALPGLRAEKDRDCDLIHLQARDSDNRFYQEHLQDWLPAFIVDAHVHVGLHANCGPVTQERLKANWAMEVGVFQSFEDLAKGYEVLFPDSQVFALAFGIPFQEVDSDGENSYLLKTLHLNPGRLSVLALVRPDWPAEKVEALLASGFAGLKPYPDFAPEGHQEVSIFSFLPHSHLKALDSAGGILMLHIPRAGRLADENNIREIFEIRQRYPSVRLVVAHVGRAYTLPNALAGLKAFDGTEGIYFDISANLNTEVFRLAIDTLGPQWLLYGSDLPITYMRGVREYEGDRYINYTDEPYSWNTNRKSVEEESQYTFYLYEEIFALRRAVESAGLGRQEFHQIMCHNGAALLGINIPVSGQEGIIRS